MNVRTIIEIQFREFDRKMLEKSMEWLNDPEIKQLTITPDIDKESQERWFQSLKDREDYYVTGIWRDEQPIGVAGIKRITSTDGELFGYIGEKKYWGKAVGIDMMKHVLDHGIFLGLSSVYAIMRKDNINSYKLHRRFGFVKEKQLDEVRVMMRLSLKERQI